MRTGTLGIVAVLVWLGGRALGQAEGPRTQVSTPPPVRQGPPPPLVLGQRVRQERARQTDLATVVVVRDGVSYLAAIRAWTPGVRFPVLIDDGTLAGREDIARFVRGYAANRVVRWSSPGAKPGFEVTVQDLIDTVELAWGVPGAEVDKGGGSDTLHGAWTQLGHTPPGIVVVSPSDGAWTAGVALAAARGQILMTTGMKSGVDRAASPEEADGLCREIEGVAARSGYPWRGVADELDAVTLCVSVPNRILKAPGEFLAMTDRVGRLGAGVVANERWAWAGQIFGTPAHAGYMAMCGVFMEPRGAWVFDGYPEVAPWTGFSGKAAGKVLGEAKVPCEVMASPRNDAEAWRARGARPVNAGLIFVNTKGNDDFFELNPGRGLPGDVPELVVPAAAAVVHSWSATNIGNRDRLGGRWLERGVFCYAGSVHEPFLGAFVPTPNAAGRMLAGAPFGAALRLDNGPLWKIAIFGDPLFTLGATGQRSMDSPTLGGLAPIDDGLREALSKGDLEASVRILLLQGRDDAIEKVMDAVLGDPAQRLTTAAACDAVLPVFRASRNDLVWRVFAKGGTQAEQEPALRDALWLSVEPLLRGAPDRAMLALLERAFRHEQASRDLGSLGKALARLDGVEAARAMFERIKSGTSDKGLRDAMIRMANSPPETW